MDAERSYINSDSHWVSVLNPIFRGPIILGALTRIVGLRSCYVWHLIAPSCECRLFLVGVIMTWFMVVTPFLPSAVWAWILSCINCRQVVGCIDRSVTLDCQSEWTYLCDKPLTKMHSLQFSFQPSIHFTNHWMSGHCTDAVIQLQYFVQRFWQYDKWRIYHLTALAAGENLPGHKSGGFSQCI